jgi:hypothetical protein
MPGNDRVPPEVYRYLLPHERRVITVRRHPAVLAGLGYGTFVVKTSGPDEKIRLLPYPEQLYLEVYGTLAPEDDEDD